MTTIETQSNTPPSPPGPRYRRALPWWTQVAVLVVVFAAGGIAGAMIAARVIHARMNEYRQNAPVFSDDIVMRLQFRLGLSETQTSAVRQIIQQRHAKMIQYRHEGSQQMHAEFDAMVNDVTQHLDDTQAQHWAGIARHVRQTYLPTTVDSDGHP